MKKLLILLTSFLMFSCGEFITKESSTSGTYVLVYRIHYSSSYVKQDTVFSNKEIPSGTMDGYNYIGYILGDQIRTTAPIEIVDYFKISK